MNREDKMYREYVSTEKIMGHWHPGESMGNEWLTAEWDGGSSGGSERDVAEAGR